MLRHAEHLGEAAQGARSLANRIKILWETTQSPRRRMFIFVALR
jgi:hypothetical protein